MHPKLPYVLFLAVLLVFNLFIFVTPFLASQGNEAAQSLYFAYAPTCHQLASRSLCLYKSKVDSGYSIGDCLPTSELSPSRENEFNYPDMVGYKIPVCARDVAIYLAMLLGLLALPLAQKIESEEWPNKWILVAAAIPIGIDGTGQLLGFWESTNFIRLVTGALIGMVLPFYILPILNSLYAFILEKLRRKKGG